MRDSSTLYAIDGLFRILSSFTQPLPPTPPTPATFYKVNVSSGDGGTVSQSALYVKEGGSVTLSARPDYGYKFLKWDDDETDNPRTITNIQDNITLAAVFKEKVPPTPPTEPDYLCFTAEKAGSTLRMVGDVNENNTHTLPSLEYSTDNGETWNTLDFTDGEVSDGKYSRVSDTLTFANVGDKILFRGNCPEGTAIFEAAMEGVESTDGFLFFFDGSDNSVLGDNIFAVSGDLQTIVDGTGENKTAPCFAALFPGEESLLITTAPDLTATQFTYGCYYGLFMLQTLLTAPARIGNVTNSSLPHDMQTGEGGYAFAEMYVYTGITTMPSLPNIVLDKNSTAQDFVDFYMNLFNIVYDTQALITSDNGRTLNGLSGINMSDEAVAHYAVIFDYETMTQADIAGMIGSLNGFVRAKIVVDDNGHGKVSCNPYLIDDDFVTDGLNFWIKDGVSEQVTLTATPHDGYSFAKWQTKSSESDEWTDDAEHLTSTLTFTAEPDEHYYYKAVFEAESQSQGE